MHRSIGWLIAALGAGAIFSAGDASAASFDCARAASRIEHLICGDIDLSNLDGQLQAAYAGALDRSLHPDQVTARQRAWLARRGDCADVKCLTEAYVRQVAALSNISDEPAICSESNTPAVNACGHEHSIRADKELDRYLAAARKRIAGEAAQDSDETVRQTPVAFDAAQAAWVAYRKAECTAYFDDWAGGTIRGAMYEGCWQSVTKARTQDVWELWLTFGDNSQPLMPKPSEK